MSKKLRTAILGASGYTGAELLRLLQNHPNFAIVALTGESQAGKEMAQVYPHLRARNLPKLVKHTEVDFSQVGLHEMRGWNSDSQRIVALKLSH